MKKKISGLFRLSVFFLIPFQVSSQVPAYVPQQGLMGFWPFTGNAQDAGTNAYNGAVSNAVLTADRFNVSGSAYYFDGSAEITTNYTGILGSGSRAVSFWARTNVGNVAMSGVAWGTIGTASRFEAGFNYGAEGPMIDGGNGVITYSTPTAISNNQWHHYVMQIVNSSVINDLEIYQDGVLLTTVANVYNGTNVLNTQNGFTVRFGSIGGSVPHYFVGDLDDIGIWDRALTICEINQLYLASTLTVTANGSQICNGSMNGTAVAVAAGLGAPYTFSWMPSGANSAAANNLGAGVHTVLVSSHQCMASATVNVAAGPQPTLQISGSNSICAGASATITASGAVGYTWQPGNMSGFLVTINPIVTTVYTVSGANAYGCVSASTITQVVAQLPVVTTSIKSLTICTNGHATLSASGASSYAWMPGLYNTATISVSPAVTTQYTVTGTGLSGCSNTAVAQVVVSECTGIDAFNFDDDLQIFPNPFSGNIRITGLKEVSAIEIMSFDGRKVATQNGVCDGSALDLEFLPAGIYFISVAGTDKHIRIIKQ